MTTNYGERPGLTVDGDREYWRGKVAEVERERDAARADAARLRAALETARVALESAPHYTVGRLFALDSIAEALSATEAGKDGAK